ncbi:MAG TPA: NlpC/P60 family protein [Burkholderiales bacterium]|nr:NlpC/P60 family protein [Burkholderiales bacterium]
MAEAIAQSPLTGSRDKIIAKAKELALKYRDSSYKEGGKDTVAFDCSYFVYLVMHEVFPIYAYANTSLIAASPNFKESENGKPGDIIFFPKGQIPYAVKKGDKRVYPNHVGIVLDSTSWVGRQSSSLGIVLFSNPWWGSRACEYYTYYKIDSAEARANGSNLRMHFA